MITKTILLPEHLESALSLRDLTDAAHGPHALQTLVHSAIRALSEQWGVRRTGPGRRKSRRRHAEASPTAMPVILHRAPPIVSVSDNYDRLHYPKEGIARDARYTRYVSEDLLLRTHTSAMIPSLLEQLIHCPISDLLLACPGLVYRRDAIDRLHTGEPHQLDLWRISSKKLSRTDLLEMISCVTNQLLPGAPVRTNETDHPYTVGGLEIEAMYGGKWIEIGECGVALPELLAETGHDTNQVSGLAMGLGLDRILMARKGIDDIRLLRSTDPRIELQLTDLEPYRPVSNQPAVRRDLSLVVDEEVDAEHMGDRVRMALGAKAEVVESIEVLSETLCEALPEAARERLGIAASQKNLLLRVLLRDLSRTLTDGEANELRNRIYRVLHEGSRSEWAS